MTAYELDRRTMLGGLASVAAFALPQAAVAAPVDKPRIDTLCADSPYFDAKGALSAGFNGAVMDLDIYPRDRENALDLLESWRRAAADPAAEFAIVRKSSDFAANRQAGKFSLLLACQDAQILGSSTFSVSDDNIGNLEELHLRGLRLLQLTHNDRNAVADSFMEKEDAGLSRLGKALVPAMARVGMIVDLSHCSDRTLDQTIALSPKPVTVTHAGCRALFPSARNKPDQAIRALADKGGYFGVFQMTRWLVRDKAKANVGAVVDHILHAANVGGWDVVGFASDRPVGGIGRDQAELVAGLANYQRRNAGVPGVDALNGHESAADLENVRRFETIDQALARRGVTAAQRDKVLGQNFLRVARDVIG